MHLGNARSFLITWARARKLGGQLLLRIEDLHFQRVKERALEQIFEDLHWLGIEWDMGPSSAQEAKADHCYQQSNRKEFYRKALNKLKENGLVYPCSCSRKDIVNLQSAPHSGEELYYPNTCREKKQEQVFAEARAKEKPVSWRFRCSDEETIFNDILMGKQSSSVSEWSGDFVVARGADDIGYQLAVVLDDIDHKVTEVIRGDDLLMSTHRQILIYKALNAHFPTYFHLPLLIGSDGKRLAKRHGDWKISTLRELGHTPKEIIGLISSTLNWAEDGEQVSLDHFLDLFSSNSIPKTAFRLSEELAQQYQVL